MDDTLQELENELKRLPPRWLSVNLIQTLERELGPETPRAPQRRCATATNLRSWKWAGWSLAGMAAALALVTILQTDRASAPTDRIAQPAVIAAVESALIPPETIPVNRYQPVKASSVLYDLKDEGLTSLPDESEGRQMRYRYLDTYTWKNPATKASLRWQVPRDEVRLIRASLD